MQTNRSRNPTGYPNTDGLGLLEYLNWAEDINAVRLLSLSLFHYRI